MAGELHSDLVREIVSSWSDLLREHSGKVESFYNLPHSTNFDYSSARVIFPELEIRITRGRGELSVDIAPTRYYGVYEDLSDLAFAVNPTLKGMMRPDTTISRAGTVLEQNWDGIVRHLSRPPEVRRRREFV